MSMTFDSANTRIEEVLSQLEQAAARGASVTLSIDAYSFMVDGNTFGPLWLHTTMPANVSEPFARKQSWINKLKSHPNSQAIVLNRSASKFSLWIAGRSHIKTAIIDNYFLFGGCNLDDPSYLDVMAGQENKIVADELYTFLGGIIQAGNVAQAMKGTDSHIDVSGGSHVLIDAGIRNQSLIYDEAIRLIDAASKWLVVTCQFFPNAKTAQHLLKAKQRGVDVEILYSPPGKHGLIGGAGQQLSVMLEKSKLPRSMFKDILAADLPLLHAKIIACDQGLLIGSHNYVQAGVKLGTAEIALLVNAEDSARAAADKIRSIIAAAQASF